MAEGALTGWPVLGYCDRLTYRQGELVEVRASGHGYPAGPWRKPTRCSQEPERRKPEWLRCLNAALDVPRKAEPPRRHVWLQHPGGVGIVPRLDTAGQRALSCPLRPRFPAPGRLL